MTDFPIYGKDAEVILHLPNSVGEISPDWLKEVSQDVEVAQHYSLIALVYREKLSSIILARTNKKKDVAAPVTPVFIKAGETDSSYVSKIASGDRIIIANSQLALGHHVVLANNELSFERVMRVIDLDTKNTYQRSLEQFNNAYVCFVEFKIVPNSDIVGNYSYKHNHYVEKFTDVISNIKAEA